MIGKEGYSSQRGYRVYNKNTIVPVGRGGEMTWDQCPQWAHAGRQQEDGNDKEETKNNYGTTYMRWFHSNIQGTSL